MPGSDDPSDLTQVMFGAGIPLAVHSNVAVCPESSCTTASFLLVIVGGTERNVQFVAPDFKFVHVPYKPMLQSHLRTRHSSYDMKAITKNKA